MTLAGKRVVVIGASSGIGRGVAEHAVDAGASVVAAARRVEKLAEIEGAIPLALDLRDPASREAFAAGVAERLGSIDLLFVSSGSAPLRSLVASDDADWLSALETNLIGVNRTLAALVGLLSEESLTALVSSETAHEPRSHLGAYGASKAALEHSIEQWREEHPWLRFTTISLGATIPTEFGAGFGHDELVEALNAWGRAGRSQAKFLSTDEVCRFLGDTFAGLLAAPSIDMREVVLRSPSPPEADVGALLGTAVEGGQTGALSDL